MRRSGVILACLVLMSGCSDGDRAFVHPLGSPGQTYTGLSKVSPTRHAIVGSMIVCSDLSDARIVSATPVKETGTITVAAIRTRSNPFIAIPHEDGIGAAYGTLAHLLPHTGEDVQRCNPSVDGTGSEIAIELSILSGTNAAAQGWTFTTRAGQRTGSFYFPLGVILCATSLDSRSCARLSKEYDGSAF